jgi:hypothetical protein
MEIFTTKGMIDESLLIKTEGSNENENEIQEWQEWHLDSELVRRDVQLHLKRGLFSDAVAAQI